MNLQEMLRDIDRTVAVAMSVPQDKMGHAPYPSAAEARMKMEFASTRVTYSPYALEATAERLFPESKHRSRRVRKKLVKRFGGEFRMRPVIWNTPMGIIAHPNFKAKLETALLKP